MRLECSLVNIVVQVSGSRSTCLGKATESICLLSSNVLSLVSHIRKTGLTIRLFIATSSQRVAAFATWYVCVSLYHNRHCQVQQQGRLISLPSVPRKRWHSYQQVTCGSWTETKWEYSRVCGIMDIAVLPILVPGKRPFELDCVLDFTEAEHHRSRLPYSI